MHSYQHTSPKMNKLL